MISWVRSDSNADGANYYHHSQQPGPWGEQLLNTYCVLSTLHMLLIISKCPGRRRFIALLSLFKNTGIWRHHKIGRDHLANTWLHPMCTCVCQVLKPTLSYVGFCFISRSDSLLSKEVVDMETNHRDSFI